MDDNVKDYYEYPKKGIKEGQKIAKDIYEGKLRTPVIPGPDLGFGGKTKKGLKKVWAFLREDSWQSLVVTLIIAFVVIKFVFFPLLSLATGSALPLVIVESCSMYHSTNLEDVLENGIYEDYGISLEDASGWGFKNGLNKGDIVFVVGDDNLEIGDVIIFEAGRAHPIIHRVISVEPLTTKGDHNSGLLGAEQSINSDTLIGRAVFRIPYVGWIKLIFFEPFRTDGERGFCS